MPEQVWVRQPALSAQVLGGFVHVRSVPVDDRGDDQVQGHDTLLLGIVRAVTDTALGMGEHGARQGMARLALVEARLALHGQLWAFDPVQHEQ